MKRTRAASVLSAFLFAQGLLGVAGLAAVVVHRHAAEAPVTVAAAAETAIR